MSQDSDTEKVFDAAKTIVETLKGLDTTHQERAIRFASESLGLGPALQTRGAEVASQTKAATDFQPLLVDRERVTDIKQFTTEKSPRSDQQFAAVVAYFYQFLAPESQKKDSIGVEELLQAARLAGRRRPNNASFILNNAKRAGYLDNPERGKFRLSTVGENLVAMTLPGTGAVVVNNRKSAKRKTRNERMKKAAVPKPRK
ncbi:MAG: hypothetical protein ABSG46_08600 [Candidatus Binataceae bacterium]